MAKRLLCALMALMLIALTGLPALAAVVKPGKDFYYLDEAGVLSEALEGEIYFSNKRLYEACGSQMVVVTVDSTGSKSISDYAVDLFNQWGIGDWKTNNGFLLLLAIGDDNYYALCGDNLQPKLTAGQLKTYLNDYLEKDFAAKRYEDGVKKFYEVIFKRIADTYNADVTVEQGIEDYRAWKGLPQRDDYFGGTPVPSGSPSARVRQTQRPLLQFFTPTPTPIVARYYTLEPVPTLPPVHLPEQTPMYYCADEADILSDDTEGKIFFVAEHIQRNRKWSGRPNGDPDCVFVSTVKSTEGMPIHDYACAVYNKWKLDNSWYNALLLMISADDGAMALVQDPRPSKKYWDVGEYIASYSQEHNLKPSKIPAMDDYEAVTLFMLKCMAETCYLEDNKYDAAIADYEAWKLDPKDEPELIPLFGEKVRPTPTPTLPPMFEPDAFAYVLDEADLLPEETELCMAFTSKLLDDATAAQLVVVTVDDTAGLSMTTYAKKLFDLWGVGNEDSRDGMMLLIDRSSKDYCILQGYKSHTLVDTFAKMNDTLSRNDEVQRFEAMFAEGEYAEGILSGYKGLLYEICRTGRYFQDHKYVTYENGVKAYEEWVSAGSDPGVLAAQGHGGQSYSKALTRADVQKQVKADRERAEYVEAHRAEWERARIVDELLTFLLYAFIAVLIIGGIIIGFTHPELLSDRDSWSDHDSGSGHSGGGGSSGGGGGGGGGGFGGGGGGGGHSSGGGAGR